MESKLNTIESVLTEQIGPVGFTDDQIIEMLVEQIISLTQQDIAQLSAKQISLFSSEQISLFSEEQISYFSKEQIAGVQYTGNYWSPEIYQEQMGISENSSGLSAKQIIALGDKVLCLGTIAITNLSSEATQAISPEYIAQFTPGQVRGLNISALTEEQVGSINAQGITELTKRQIEDLGKMISHLSLEATGALTPEQVGWFSIPQASKLTVLQIKSLRGAQIKMLSGQHIAAFSQTQIKALLEDVRQYAFIFLLMNLKFEPLKFNKERILEIEDDIRIKSEIIIKKLVTKSTQLFDISYDQIIKEKSDAENKKTSYETSSSNNTSGWGVNLVSITGSEKFKAIGGASFNLANQVTQQSPLFDEFSQSLRDEISNLTRMFVQLMMLYVPFNKKETEDLVHIPLLKLTHMALIEINFDNSSSTDFLDKLILSKDIVEKLSYTSHFNNIQIIALKRSISEVSNLYQTQFGYSMAALTGGGASQTLENRQATLELTSYLSFNVSLIENLFSINTVIYGAIIELDTFAGTQHNLFSGVTLGNELISLPVLDNLPSKPNGGTTISNSPTNKLPNATVTWMISTPPTLSTSSPFIFSDAFQNSFGIIVDPNNGRPTSRIISILLSLPEDELQMVLAIKPVPNNDFENTMLSNGVALAEMVLGVQSMPDEDFHTFVGYLGLTLTDFDRNRSFIHPSESTVTENHADTTSKPQTSFLTSEPQGMGISTPLDMHSSFTLSVMMPQLSFAMSEITPYPSINLGEQNELIMSNNGGEETPKKKKKKNSEQILLEETPPPLISHIMPSLISNMASIGENSSSETTLLGFLIYPDTPKTW